jgi:hypothetical protein
LKGTFSAMIFATSFWYSALLFMFVLGCGAA